MSKYTEKIGYMVRKHLGLEPEVTPDEEIMREYASYLHAINTAPPEQTDTYIRKWTDSLATDYLE